VCGLVGSVVSAVLRTHHLIHLVVVDHPACVLRVLCWQAAMEAGRRLREEQYAALKDKEWEDTLRREAEMHRSEQHTHSRPMRWYCCMLQDTPERPTRFMWLTQKHLRSQRNLSLRVLHSWLFHLLCLLHSAASIQAYPAATRHHRG